MCIVIIAFCVRPDPGRIWPLAENLMTILGEILKKGFRSHRDLGIEMSELVESK